jgi:hypothetical protein
MAAMRREGIAASSDEQAAGFGMGIFQNTSLSAGIDAWFWCPSHLAACPLESGGAGTSARRQAFDRRAQWACHAKPQAINAVVPAVLPFA